MIVAIDGGLRRRRHRYRFLQRQPTPTESWMAKCKQVKLIINYDVHKLEWLEKQTLDRRSRIIGQAMRAICKGKFMDFSESSLVEFWISIGFCWLSRALFWCHNIVWVPGSFASQMMSYGNVTKKLSSRFACVYVCVCVDFDCIHDCGIVLMHEIG